MQSISQEINSLHLELGEKDRMLREKEKQVSEMNTFLKEKEGFHSKYETESTTQK